MTIWSELADNLLTWDTACFVVNAGVFGVVNRIYNDRYKTYLAVSVSIPWTPYLAFEYRYIEIRQSCYMYIESAE